MELIKGRRYYYWSKSIYEDKPSKKTCTLLRVSSNGKHAVVQRHDLTVNKVQIIKADRLKEIEKSNVDNTPNLFPLL